MTRQQDTAQNADRWQVERLRATTFHLPGLHIPESVHWWEEVIGDKPEQTVTRPKEGAIQQLGVFEGKQLVLSGRQARVDWNLQAIAGLPSEPMQGLPTLGPLPDSLESFRKVAEKWLNVSPDITRLASGAVLVIKGADLPSAYPGLSHLDFGELG